MSARTHEWRLVRGAVTLTTWPTSTREECAACGATGVRSQGETTKHSNRTACPGRRSAGDGNALQREIDRADAHVARNEP